MNHTHLSELIDRAKDRQVECEELRKYILEKTGLPKNRTNIVTFHSIYPVEDKIYNKYDIFDPDVIFEYVYAYEKYNKRKKYKEVYTVPVEEAQDVLTLPERLYLTEKSFCTYFYVAVDKLFRHKYRIFVITDEIFTQQDIDLLSKYCQCTVCRTPWLSPFKYIMCRECEDCLTIINKELRGYHYIIDITRKHIINSYKATSFL